MQGRWRWQMQGQRQWQIHGQRRRNKCMDGGGDSKYKDSGDGICKDGGDGALIGKAASNENAGDFGKLAKKETHNLRLWKLVVDVVIL